MVFPRGVRSALVGCVLALAALASASALSGPTYLPLSSLDLAVLLPPPPSSDSKAQADDIATVGAIQEQASPERRAEAVADADMTPQRIAGAILGPGFTSANAPKTFALLRRVTVEAGSLSERAKAEWARPRPFLVDPHVAVLVRKPKNAAYPSGHTIFAYEMAVILGMMVPERRPDLFARAADYGQSRIIVGVHYLTDIDAGRVAGTAIATLLLNTDGFKADLAEATGELRAALGLPPVPASRI